MIAILTDAPLMPLTQMVAGDAAIQAVDSPTHPHAVLTEDDLTAYWISKTLGYLGYQVLVQTEVGMGD